MSEAQAEPRDYGRPEDHPGFLDREYGYRCRWADIALGLGVVLMPLGVMMDWSVYREQFEILFGSRIAVTLLLALGFLTRRFWPRGFWFSTLSFFFIIAPALYFCWIIYVTNGSQSLYYFALILLMILVQLLGFRAGESAAYCGVSTAAYILAVFANQGFAPTIDADFGQGIFFLSICSVASVFVCATYRRNRFEAYCLNQDLANEQERLRQSMEQLRETEQRLVHSEKMRAIAGVAAGLLHEINNPVNYSLMAIKVLKKKNEPGTPNREMIDDVEAGVSRIGNIVSDLQSFAHPEQLSVQAPFRIRDAMMIAIRFLTHELPDGRVELDESGDLDARVMGAQSQIVQVLLNVILNAENAIQTAHPELRYETDGGGGEVLQDRIVVSAAAKKDRLHVSVVDSGIGMDEGQLKMVKEPFFTTRSGEGLGLGLGICETILRSHGGTIEIESQPGIGTKVTFDLPLAVNTDGGPVSDASELGTTSKIFA